MAKSIESKIPFSERVTLAPFVSSAGVPITKRVPVERELMRGERASPAKRVMEP